MTSIQAYQLAHSKRGQLLAHPLAVSGSFIRCCMLGAPEVQARCSISEPAGAAWILAKGLRMVPSWKRAVSKSSTWPSVPAVACTCTAQDHPSSHQTPFPSIDASHLQAMGQFPVRDVW